jgi:hypothetical protein
MLEIVRKNGSKYVRCISGICVFETARHGYHISDDELIKRCNRRPAEDAKDKEIERLKNDLEIQKNLTRMACFESNRAYDEVEKWKKMFYDLIDKQSNVATDPKVIIVGKDTNVPTNAPDMNDGKMEGGANVQPN